MHEERQDQSKSGNSMRGGSQALLTLNGGARL
jgi:hypothetical protein